ncbi:MAG TPA: hypothetical protein PLK19_15325 [Mycobacterium sp.]|nr:hypothetical protein [Mycobacterium sp.]
MKMVSARMVIGASSLALLFAGLSGIGAASADSGSGQVAANQAAAPKTAGEKRKHRNDRKVASLGSTSECNQKCQLVQHFNNYGFNEARIFIPGNFYPNNNS